MANSLVADNLYATTTEVLIRVLILRTHYKIDKESAEIITALAELIRLRLRSNSPNYREIAGLAVEITDALRQAETAVDGGIYS